MPSATAKPADRHPTELNGIRVLVTGATSGLGAAMAAALAEAGARVMVSSRDQARAESTADGLGLSAIPCQLDVRDERSVAACIDRADDGPPRLRAHTGRREPVSRRCHG